MKTILLYIFLPIMASVSGEFLLKAQLNQTSIGFVFQDALWLITNPWILLGVGLIACSAIFWVVGMSQFQLSFMYPFLSLNYVIIVIGSEYWLNEDVSWTRYLAVACIVIGLMVMSKSPNSSIKE